MVKFLILNENKSFIFNLALTFSDIHILFNYFTTKVSAFTRNQHSHQFIYPAGRLQITFTFITIKILYLLIYYLQCMFDIIL